MYLELRIAADYGNKANFVSELKKEIGINAIAVASAVQKTSLHAYAAIVAPKVIAAEQIQHKTFILYFLEGSDTIVVHISGQNVAETKDQAARIVRRLPKLFSQNKAKVKSSAIVYVANSMGFDTAIISGKRVGKFARFIDVFAERWMTRLITPAIIFSAAAAFLPATTFFQSALIGLIAAILALLIEGLVFAFKADEWDWTEV